MASAATVFLEVVGRHDNLFQLVRPGKLKPEVRIQHRSGM